MLHRLVEACFAVLVAAIAIYVAVRLVESVAGTLVVIVAGLGGLVVAGWIMNALWRRRRLDRW